MAKEQLHVRENSVPTSLGNPHQNKWSSWGFWKGLWLLVFSLCCCVVALVAICVDKVSSTLGSRGNVQLIVVGFATAVMNICFNSEVQTLILTLETQLGPLTLPNYEAILCNDMFTDKAHFHTRALVAFLIAFPLGLSVAYKRFDGGNTIQHSRATFTSWEILWTIAG